MKISTEINSIASIVGEEKAVELVAKAGFDGWDYSLFPMARYDFNSCKVLDIDHPLRNGNAIAFSKRLKKIGEDNGIVCNQSHAPFPVFNKEIKDSLKKAIECTAVAGGKICIIHPNNDLNAERNAELYMSLLPFAVSHNVKIAVENMWNWNGEKDCAEICACSTPKSFNEHLKLLPKEHIGACLDIGHAEMRGLNTSAVELIYALKERLIALHIHDNDKWHDSHNIPYSMDIDFKPILKALKEVKYSGYFTLEADMYLRKGYNTENVIDGVKNLYKSAKRLSEEYERV